MENGNSLIGKTLGTCTLERLIGQGGMGVVYLARQTRPARYVAVKLLLPNLDTNSLMYREFLARFQREADVIAQLEQANIMPIFEYGEQNGTAYLVMPYFPGKSLRDKLLQQPVPPLHDTANYITQAAAALDYAHAHHVVHRDLKPGNFLLHNDGRLILTDFGIARMMQKNDNASQPTLTSTGMMLGTPEYMAPEMFTGTHVDSRADIYALGIILYQLLSGQTPFKGDTFYAIATKHLHDTAPSLLAINPSLPPTTDAVVQTVLAKNPENRFQSAGALATALRKTLDLTPQTDILALPTLITPPKPVTTGPTIRVNNAQTGPTQVMPPSVEHVTQNNIAQPVTPITPITATPFVHHVTRNRQQPLLLFVGLLLVIALVVGGILIGLQLNKGSSPTSVATGTTTVPSTTVTTITQATTTPVATTQPTATTAPTTAPSPAAIPKGALLYSTQIPGTQSKNQPSCDSKGETWADYNGAQVLCQGSYTQISNLYNDPPDLVGTLLLKLPGDSFTISNYVIEVTLQQVSTSHADFGVYFRNQPGNLQGVYTFLIHPDGTWSTYVYSNNTPVTRTELANGNFGSAYASVTLDVVVNGANFSFYANSKIIKSVNDGTYPTGTVGIAVDAGGTILASNFALYEVS